MLQRRSSQRGYSLFELIVVMFIIMMLAVNILPRYLKLYHDMQYAALNSVASSLTTVSSVNYIQSKYQKQGWFRVSNCIDVVQGLDNPMPVHYNIVPQAVLLGKTATCLLTNEDEQRADFIAVGT